MFYIDCFVFVEFDFHFVKFKSICNCEIFALFNREIDCFDNFVFWSRNDYWRKSKCYQFENRSQQMIRCNEINTNYTLIWSWRIFRYNVYDMWKISDCSFLTFHKMISWFSECNQMMLSSLRQIREMILRKNLDSNWKLIAHTFESRLEGII